MPIRASFGQLLDLPRLLLDGLDAVVQEEDLALPVHFAVDRLADQSWL